MVNNTQSGHLLRNIDIIFILLELFKDMESTLNIMGSREQSQEMELETELKALELERQILEKERHLQDARENLAKMKAARVSDTEDSISYVGQLSSSTHGLQNHSSSSSSILSDTDCSTTASSRTAATPRRRQRHVQHTQREEQKEDYGSISVGGVKTLMTWRICLIVAGLLVSCSTLYFVTYSELPDITAPQLARITLTQSDRITVAWRSPDGRYDGFRLECYDAHGKDIRVTDVTRDVNEGSCTDLIPGTKYDVTVTTMVEGKPSHARTYVGLIRTDAGAPQLAKVTVNQMNKITVGWRAPEGRYDAVRLQCYDAESNDRRVTDVARGANGGSCTDLTAGTEYDVTVSTLMAGIETSQSKTLLGLIRTEVAGPQDTTVVFTTNTSITVKWTAPEGKYDQVRIECISDKTRSVADVERTQGNQGTCMNLVPGTKYRVTVVSMVTKDAKHSAKIGVGIIATVLAVPTQPRVGEVTKYQISITWRRPKGNYDKVRLICTTQDGTQTYTDIRRGDKSIGSCNGLQSGTEYYITLATMMDDESVGAQIDIFGIVRTELTIVGKAYAVVSGNKCAIGGAILTSILAPYAAPVALGALGFGTAGIGAGTIAASMMSSAALSGGGGIAAGSLVAVLQSAGAAGIGSVTTAALAAIGSAVGAGVGAATCTEGCG